MLRIEEDVINVDALKRVKECRSEFLSEKHGHIPFNDLISAYPGNLPAQHAQFATEKTLLDICYPTCRFC